MIKAVSAQSIRDVFTARGDMIFLYAVLLHGDTYCLVFLVWDIKLAWITYVYFFSPVVMLLTNDIDLLNQSKKRTNDRLGDFETE